jgi:hypothetical protein
MAFVVSIEPREADHDAVAVAFGAIDASAPGAGDDVLRDEPLEDGTGLLRASSTRPVAPGPQPASSSAPVQPVVQQANQRVDVTCHEGVVRAADRRRDHGTILGRPPRRHNAARVSCPLA